MARHAAQRFTLTMRADWRNGNHFMDIQSNEILQFFAYEHLPPHLQEVSKPFGEMAKLITQAIPRNAERDMALRKLLEAKDCAVRAVLFK